MRLRCTLVRSRVVHLLTHAQASRCVNPGCPRRRVGTRRSPVPTGLRNRVAMSYGVPTDGDEALFSWLHDSGVEPYNLKVHPDAPGSWLGPLQPGLPLALFDLRGHAGPDPSVSTTGTRGGHGHAQWARPYRVRGELGSASVVRWFARRADRVTESDLSVGVSAS